LNQPLFETLLLSPAEAARHSGSWQVLANRAMEPNPFFEPGFVLPLSKALNSKELCIVALVDRSSGDWLIAAPFLRRRPGFLISGAICWATEFGPLGAPLIAPGLPDEAATHFLEAVSKGLKTRNIAFPYLPLEGPASTLLRKAGGRHLKTTGVMARAAHHGGVSGQAELESFRRSKRHKELGRQLRRLGDIGEIAFKSAHGEEAITDFSVFQVLEAAGWKGRKGTALTDTPAVNAFADTMFGTFAEHDRARIDSLLLDGRPVAMLVLIMAANQVFSWKIAFDESLAKYSPGAQITFQAMKTNLAGNNLCLADSLAVPGHSMIEPIWRSKRSFGTLLCCTSGKTVSLWERDLKALSEVKKAAKKMLRHS